MGTRIEWVRDFLATGGYPQTDDNVRALLAWCRSEFGGSSPNPAAYNLFATTQDAPGATDFNSVHVRNYPDWWTGVHANVVTLAQGFPGYQSIRDHLYSGQDASATCAAVSASPWGSHPNDAIIAEVLNDPANNADVFVGDRSGDVPVPVPVPPVTDDQEDTVGYKVEKSDGTVEYRLSVAGGSIPVDPALAYAHALAGVKFVDVPELAMVGLDLEAWKVLHTAVNNNPPG